MSTPFLLDRALWARVRLTSTQSERQILPEDNFYAAVQRIMHFSASRRLAPTLSHCFPLLLVSACRPDRALLRPHVPLQQLVLCATSSLVTTSLHPFRQRRSRLRCRTSCRLSLLLLRLLSFPPLPLSLRLLWLSFGALHAMFCNCCLAFLGRVSDIVLGLASSISVAPRLPCACPTHLILREDTRHVPPVITAPTRPASCEVGAVRSLSSLPLLPPVFVPFVALTHFHPPSDSSDEIMDLAPRFLLGEVVRKILLSWDPPHFHSSRFGHLLQP